METEKKRLIAGLIVFFGVAAAPLTAQGAILSISPSAETFEVGSVFNCAVLLNTEGETINAVAVSLSFPPDKLQVISPAVGQSIIEIWATPLKYDNQKGIISFQGGIPGGISTAKGQVLSLAFQVKAVGKAIVNLSDDSKALLHDGQGTEALRSTINGVYSLELPVGPAVSSDTHPDTYSWYSNPNVVLRWPKDPRAEGYSFMLNSEPADTPDDVFEQMTNSVVYYDTGDGTHYFHIKAFKNRKWGEVTHFAFQTDTVPPDNFSIKIMPATMTSQRQPVIQFSAADALSGIGHYELKIISLREKDSEQAPFIEVQSPYTSQPLEFGAYEVIVRAYDAAGNYKESVRRLSVVRPLLQIIKGHGIQFNINGGFIISWQWLWVIILAFLAVTVFISRKIKK